MRRYCPICDRSMPTGTFCKTCKRFVKPKEDNSTYYLNESHTDTRAHHDSCEYHETDTKYSSKPTYTLNKNNTYENRNAASTVKPAATSSARPNVRRTAASSSSKKKNPAATLVVIIFLIIFAFNFIIPIAAVVFTEIMDTDEYTQEYTESVNDKYYAVLKEYAKLPCTGREVTDFSLFEKNDIKYRNDSVIDVTIDNYTVPIRYIYMTDSSYHTVVQIKTIEETDAVKHIVIETDMEPENIREMFMEMLAALNISYENITDKEIEAAIFESTETERTISLNSENEIYYSKTYGKFSICVD